MAAGDFTASALLSIKLKAEAMWADARLSQDFKANAQAAVAVKRNSSATFRELEDSDKENTVIVTFINPCAVAVADCTTDCTIAGNELESGSKTYTLDLCKEVVFTVDAEKTRTNAYSVEELSARGLAAAVKALDEWWAQQILIKLHAFEGINVDPAPYTYAAGTTTIPNASYNLSVIPNIMYDAMVNKLNSPYYINNGDLWVAWTNAQLNAANLDGKGDAARAAQLNMYFDPFNFSASGTTESIFAVSSSAVAFVTKTRYSSTPVLVGGSVQQTRYTVPSSVIPGVAYDVIYTLACTSVGAVAHVKHSWKVKTQGGIFLNPEGCPVTISAVTYNPTGVLSYTHGA
jgi:hypothetical protein